MVWSTSQLARIAGTTLNTVRHYHRIGVLPEPERASNGYKQYGIQHLVQLVRIRRLSALGIPLTRIAASAPGAAASFEEIRSLDAELEARIRRLQGARKDLAELMSHQAPAETPAGFAAVASSLSESQRGLLAVYTTVFDGPTLESFRQAVLEPEPTDLEFDRLPAEATDAEIEDLARRMVPAARRTRTKHPELTDALERSPHGAEAAGLILAHALVELYHGAQIRTLQRLETLLAEEVGAAEPDGS
ncbi:MerR family transcriptional regulator [Brachybacterium sp. GCM10030267]|uniref:MerR family transcriptional regulator n=1 Tax=Brachybacterium sp. GCM10030267 TaxID=3273381 RepID=UPI00361A69A9